MKRIFTAFIALLIGVMMYAQPKYIFYFIGDGMGCNQVLAAEMYLAEIQGRIGIEPLSFAQFPFSGQLATYSASNGITDSSAAGTCLASGVKTTNHYEGVDPLGKPAISVAEKLHKAGWAVGVSSTVSIDNATPAAFYAHVPDRSDAYTIGTQLANSGYEYFAGATFVRPDHKTDKDLPNLYELCEQNGYTFVHGVKEYRPGLKKVIMIQENEGKDIHKGGSGLIPLAISRKDGDMTQRQIVEIGIKQLENYDRFFLMSEGGSIDRACHGNDAGTTIHEVIDFADAIQPAIDFYRAHPDETLIIVTADHETGGMALGNSNVILNLKALQAQVASKGSFNYHIRAIKDQYGKKMTWEQVKEVLKHDLGLYTTTKVSEEEDAMLQALFAKLKKGKSKNIKDLYGEADELSDAALALLNKKAKIGWTTRSHTASPVPIFTIGNGAEKLAGWHDNKDVAPIILRLVGLE